ncbi:hypothetical protein [Amycolatopsis sp. NPDC004079]|uniref:hypothetical protein n=1 Tax=Amycolatopsis sp. NPDC004079 TaxID=3154549 RepID=UPI0033AB0D04
MRDTDGFSHVGDAHDRDAGAGSSASPYRFQSKSPEIFAAIVANVLAGRYPVDNWWASEIDGNGIDVVPGEPPAIVIRTTVGQVFRLAVTEAIDSQHGPIGGPVDGGTLR